MANIYDPTEEQLAQWEAWVRSRPASIQENARKFVPWKLYRLTPSGSRVVLYSYAEDGTMTVAVLGKWNALAFERSVFGVKPEMLEECELPGPDVMLGVFGDEP